MAQEFDLLTVPLTGANLIEAGAGTGKTYSISGLYIRLLLEKDLSVDQILVVTFTVAATEELKHRIRNKIIEAIDVIKTGRSQNDPTLEALTRKYVKRKSAIDKLEYSLHQFDEAAIFTIHGFCSRMLNDYTFESNTPFDTEFIRDQKSLLNQSVYDFWRKHIAGKSNMFLEYLINNENEKLDTPDKLIKLVSSLYTKPFLEIIPKIMMPEVFPLESRFLSGFEKVRDSWSESRQQVEDIFLTHASLNRNKYRKNSIPKWFNEMETMFTTGQPSPAMFKHFEKFTTSVINASLKGKNPDQIYHPFFELCEELNSYRTELMNAYDNSILAIKSNLYEFIRSELLIKKKNANVQFFDDLLTALYNSLNSPTGKHLTSLIRKRYKAALIDEFQDTDPIQYSIFKTIFNSTENILFLIGDPKQAIYAFRGADIFAYIEAVDEVDNCYTLSKNWRSQADLLLAINTIYNNIEKPFVYDQIPYTPARPANADSKQILELAGIANPPLELWYLDSRNLGEQYITRGLVSKAAAIKFMADSVTAEIVKLLNLADNNKAIIENRHLRANDIAVLVRTNSEAAITRESLDRFNIPSILYSDKSVFASNEAIDLLRLIVAVAEPTNSGSVKAALSTVIFGLSGEDIYKLGHDDTEWENQLAEFRKLNDLWREYGFISMFRYFISVRKIHSNILKLSGGERRLTNILHLGELIHNRITESNSSMSVLINWFKQQIQDSDNNQEGSQLRLESDDNAVKIVTIHKSKGLEYDVVFCPFAWGNSRITKNKNVLFHDKENQNTLTLDLGSENYEPNKTKAELELLAENVRLLYVALTRAKHRCYLGWGLFNTAGSSAMAYTFHQPNLNELVNTVDEVEANFLSLNDSQALDSLTDLTNRSENSINLKVIPGSSPHTYKPLITEKQNLTHLEFKGAIDREWRISSFTNLSAGKTHQTELPDYDSFTVPFIQAETITDIDDTDSIFTFPKGARAGTFCHELFENIDFQNIKDDYIDSLITNKLKQFGFESKWHNTIFKMIENTLNVSLSGNNDAFNLSQIAKSERLIELEFYFPLNRIVSGNLNNCFEKFMKDNNPAISEITWRKLNFHPVKGYIKGFIDLVFIYNNKYYLLDWKSNHLGNSRKLYSQEYLSQAMIENQYILQYHLYSVALHQYLSVRLDSYDYNRDFGGVYYLFLRGLDSGSDDNNGIYYDKPSIELMDELTSILIPGSHTNDR